MSDGPLVVMPPPETGLLRWATESVNTIAIVEVTDTISELSIAEDWVSTKITALVTSVMKATSPGPMQAGATMHIRQQGGVTTLGGTTVTVKVPWEPLVAHGKTYLVFLDVEGNGEQLLAPRWTYEIDASDRLRRLSDEPAVVSGARDDVNGHPVADIVSRIKHVLSPP
jgi:hypothetical protein